MHRFVSAIRKGSAFFYYLSMKAANTLPHVGEFNFRQLDDYRYHCVSGNFEGSPADFCEVYGIAVPDDCQFLRIKSYVRHLYLTFRDYGGKIQINVFPLD